MCRPDPSLCHKNRLKQQITPSQTLEYEYDIMNRRTSKNVKPNPANGEESTSYLYKYNDYSLMEEQIEKKNQAGQVIDTKVINYTYSDSNTPLGFTIDDNNYFYVTDGHNDVREITDSSGNTIVRYQYDAWGNHMDIKAYASQVTTLEQAQELAVLNPYRYASYRYDDETGLYYLRERYYDPVTGRFLSKDPEKYPNLYIYCQNNPINRYDPSGRGDQWIEFTVVYDKEWRLSFGDDWANAIHRRFQTAMNFYQNHLYDGKPFGIKWRIGWRYYLWDSPDSEKDPINLMMHARTYALKQQPYITEVVAAFTGQPFKDLSMAAAAIDNRDVLIIRYVKVPLHESYGFQHEMGHLYGLKHCEDIRFMRAVKWGGYETYSPCAQSVIHTCFLRRYREDGKLNALCNMHKSALWSRRFKY